MSEPERERLTLLIHAFDVARQGPGWCARSKVQVQGSLLNAPLVREMGIKSDGQTIGKFARRFRDVLLRHTSQLTGARLRGVLELLPSTLGAIVGVPIALRDTSAVSGRAEPAAKGLATPALKGGRSRSVLPRDVDDLITMSREVRRSMLKRLDNEQGNMLGLMIESIERGRRDLLPKAPPYHNVFLSLIGADLGNDGRAAFLASSAMVLDAEIRTRTPTVRKPKAGESVKEWVSRCSTRRLTDETETDRLRLAAEVQFRLVLPAIELGGEDLLSPIDVEEAAPHVNLPASTWLRKPTYGGANSRSSAPRPRTGPTTQLRSSFARCSCGMPTVPGTDACAVCLQSVE